MIKILRLVFSILFVFMCYKVATTAIHNNLFEQWDFLGSIAWMRTTLFDFYANIFIILLWMFYKETKIWSKLLWSILFITLGSIATLGYVLIKLYQVNENDSIDKLVSRK